MSKYDVREYLTKIYNLPVRDVRTEVNILPFYFFFLSLGANG